MLITIISVCSVSVIADSEWTQCHHLFKTSRKCAKRRRRNNINNNISVSLLLPPLPHLFVRFPAFPAEKLRDISRYLLNRIRHKFLCKKIDFNYFNFYSHSTSPYQRVPVESKFDPSDTPNPFIFVTLQTSHWYLIYDIPPVLLHFMIHFKLSPFDSKSFFFPFTREEFLFIGASLSVLSHVSAMI